jgi:hypothetical protein
MDSVSGGTIGHRRLNRGNSMRRFASGLTVAALVLACDNPLDVPNTNDPNTEQVLNSAGDIETLIGGTFREIHVTTVSTNDNVDNQMKVMAFESYATVNNFGMNVRAPVPRGPLLNEPGNNVQGGNYRDFLQLQVQARSTANYIAALDRLQKADPQPILDKKVGRVNAARAFGFFTLGLAQGYTAMVYDSAAVVTPETPIESQPLQGYNTVMANALSMMDSALAVATSPASVGDETNFRIQSIWIPSPDFSGGMTRAQFIQLVRSYKARLRASVARTPTERAAVDWAQVVADATNGLPNGLRINLTDSGGWDHGWISNQYRYGGWHNMSNHFIGMADTSGGYDVWLASRDANGQAGASGPFLIRTPDLRFPSGDTRAQQIANSPTSQVPPAPPTGRQYFRNRSPGDDTPTPAHGDSWYDHARFFAIFAASDLVGVWPTMSITELDMLAAEGKLRPGPQQDIAGALALINKTRTTSGLPALIAAGTVPGGNACVPRVPVGPSGTSTQCGNEFEAMKYEKRLETAITGYGQWFFDSRGWGDLPEGTALHWPVPWQETDARVQAFYSLGGPTRICTGTQTPASAGCSAAAKSTYGAW